MPKESPSPDDRMNELRARIAQSPTKPGVYRWLSKNDDVLYVGKAKNLQSRLKSYVQKKPDKSLGPWKLALIEKIEDVDWTITSTEVEALVLETNLIKELKPKYNVLLKDDKSYVYVKITDDAYPRVEVVREIAEGIGLNDGNADKKAKYFGPFLSSHHIRKSLEMLHEVYEWRACKRSLDLLNKPSLVLRQAQDDIARDDTVNTSPKLKPCLDSQIGKCNGLCCGKITKCEYRNRMNQMMQFFKGDRKDLIVRITERMQEYAEKKRFEDAAKLRDTLNYVRSLDEQQIVSDASGANTDAIGVALLKDHAHVVVLRERGGKVIGERSFSLAGMADTVAEVLTQFIPQYYAGSDDIPDTILCAEEPEECEAITDWLSTNRNKITLHTPERGKKSKLLKMAEENAMEKIKQALAKWEAASAKVETALEELKTYLDLASTPKRIECYDISHLGGEETVGSMVVAIHGKTKNADYRSFTIRTMKKGEIDDYKALKEVLRRRLRHLQSTETALAKKLEEEGVTIRKLKKKEQDIIANILNNVHLDTDNLDYKSIIVAEHENEIIGCCRLKEYKSGVTELSGLWVREEFQNGQLGYTLARSLLKRIKKGKVYCLSFSHLASFYSSLGFEYIREMPDDLQKKYEKCLQEDPDHSDGIAMMYDTKKNKKDSSLTSEPDLLVLDGGKGQLSTGVEVLKKMNLSIPIIGLAKREEEVFEPNNAEAIAFPKDSEGLFLLMRLRDEAHRSANAHREKRLKRRMYS